MMRVWKVGSAAGALGNSDFIGVFDSGLGGLSVLREIRKRLPAEKLVYVADSAHVPYGGHDEAFIRRRSIAIADYLAEAGARMLVVACNTATAAAVPTLRQHLPVPVVGMEPAVKPAAAATRSGVVGVLATIGTLRSARFAALLDRFGAGIEVLTEPCPGLVEAVESGALNSTETVDLVERHVRPLIQGGADTIILGCTHYTFLRPSIESAAGPGVSIIDTGSAVARQVAARLGGGARRQGEGTERFLTTGPVQRLSPVLEMLWPGARALEALTLPDGSSSH
ncbi:MAG: glutamate racemase [Gammaproteobacteria bacterium]|jgi:glutamate racemase